MKKFKIILFAFAAFACAALAAPLFETTQVHPAYPKNRPNYRIPALIQAPNGDLLIFTEKRNSGPGDVGDTDLTLARSSDFGKTWNEELIFDDGSDTCTDTTICVDRERGRIFLFFMRDKKRFAYLFSDDSGKRWQGPVDIHDAVTPKEWERFGLEDGRTVVTSTDAETPKNASKAVRWKTNWAQRYGVGPGNAGIQLRSGAHKGRLLVPARHRESRNGKNVSMNHILYSDDHGKTWHRGASVNWGGNESRLVELSDGRVMLNMRNAISGISPDEGWRMLAFSADGGDTWGPSYFERSLPSTAVHASIMRYGVQGRYADMLLFANPACPIRQKEHPYGRYNVTVRWSLDDGRTWSAGRTLWPHAGSYTDIAPLSDGTVGVVYERGARKSDHYWDEIHFARFNLEWLFDVPWEAVPENPNL